MRGAAYGRLLWLPLSTPAGTYYSAAVSPPGLFWRLGDTLVGSLTYTFHIHSVTVRMKCFCLTPPQSIVLMWASVSWDSQPFWRLRDLRLLQFLLGRQQRKKNLKQLFHFSAAVFRLFSFHRHYLRFTANIWASNPLYWLRLTSVILLLFPVVSIPRSITSSMLPDCYEVQAGGSIPAQHPYGLAII